MVMVRPMVNAAKNNVNAHCPHVSGPPQNDARCDPLTMLSGVVGTNAHNLPSHFDPMTFSDRFLP